MSFEIGDEVWLHKRWDEIGLSKRGRIEDQRTNAFSLLKQCLVVSEQIGCRWVDEMYLTRVSPLELLAEVAGDE